MIKFRTIPAVQKEKKCNNFLPPTVQNIRARFM